MSGQSGDSRSIRNVTLVGAAINIALMIGKIVVGKLVGSIALVADGLHSLSDLLTDAAVIAGAKAAERPVDDTHPYGHGKFETIAAIFVALVLIAVGGWMAWSALNLLVDDVATRPPGTWVLVLAGVSVVSKEWLYWITRAVAKRANSPAALANAWHHRSDAFSSVVVIVGTIGGMLGWEHGDAFAGLVVAVMIAIVGARVGMNCLGELTDGAIEPQVRDQVARLIASHPEVRDHHELRTRHVGREIFVDVHILVDADMSVLDGHQVATDLEKMVETHVDAPVNLLVHVEPDVPEQRKD